MIAWTVWIAIGAAILIAALLLFAPKLVSRWLGQSKPKKIRRPSADQQRFGGPAFEPADDMRERVADLRWRAASQLLYTLGALRAPGLLRQYVEDADPVQSVANLIGLLGEEPSLVFNAPDSFDRHREAFLDRLEAFCILEEELGSPSFPQSYRDQVLQRLQKGDFSFAQDLADSFAEIREARARFDAAHEYEGAPPFKIISLARVEASFVVLEDSLAASVPEDPRATLAKAKSFNIAAGGFMELALQTLELVNNWEELVAEIESFDATDDWAQSQFAGVADLATRFDHAVAGIYAESAELSDLFEHLDRLRVVIAELSRYQAAFTSRYGEPGKRSKDSRGGGGSGGTGASGHRSRAYGSPPPRTEGITEAELWTYFGIVDLAPGQRPAEERVKAEFRQRAKKIHPDLARTPGEKQRFEAEMKELNAKYDQARRYLGVKVDKRV